MKYLVKSIDVDYDSVAGECQDAKETIEKVIKAGRLGQSVSATREDGKVTYEYRQLLPKPEIIDLPFGDPKPERIPGQRICGKCGESGHNARTCGKPKVEKLPSSPRIAKQNQEIEQEVLDKYETVICEFLKEHPGMQKNVLINIIPENHYYEVVNYLLDKNSIRREGKKRGTKYYIGN